MEIIHIYGLMGDSDLRKKPAFTKLQTMISEALNTYRAQDFDKAKELFNSIRTLGGIEQRPWSLDITLDTFCDLYEERIAEYKTNPPAKDWDGVFIATSK